MDFVNKAFAQLNDLFKSMTPGARITAGLLLVTVLVSLGYLFNTQVSAPDHFLMGGEQFAASQLPGMEAAFAKANLTGYEIDGNRVRVPRGQQAAYMGALADAGALPPDFGKFLEKAVGASNPFMNRDQREAMLKVAKQSELQLIIRSMKGIETASVLYDVENKSGLLQASVTKASVTVKPVGAQPLEEDRVAMLRHLVAGAIANLKPEDVTVIDANGRAYPGGSGSGNGQSAIDDKHVSLKKMYEAQWQSKITSALAYVPGAIVQANVELDLETEHRETIQTFDPKAVVFDQEQSNLVKTAESAAPGGQVGVNAQGATSNQPAVVRTAQSGPKSSEETERSHVRNAVPSTQKQIAQHGLTPKRVMVSVAVPSSYYEKVWLEKNPTAEGQAAKKPDATALADIETKVKQDLEKAVVPLLPRLPPGVDPYPQVTVTTFQTLPTAAPLAPGGSEQALAWLGQYWSTLGMSLLGLISLVMLRSMVRSTAGSATSNPAQAAGAANDEAPGANLSVVSADGAPAAATATPSRSRLKRAGAGGPSLRDDLAELVREDPDTAVNILRNWIGTAT